MHDNDPEVLEREKQRNLLKIQHKTSTPHEHAPGWNEHLATASEASVKVLSSSFSSPLPHLVQADKSTGSIFDLQRKTVEYVSARHSPEDQSCEATYSHDSVLGPLRSAEGAEDLHTHHEGVQKKKAVRSKVTEEKWY
jgi:hypothetical protein